MMDEELEYLWDRDKDLCGIVYIHMTCIKRLLWDQKIRLGLPRRGPCNIPCWSHSCHQWILISQTFKHQKFIGILFIPSSHKNFLFVSRDILKTQNWGVLTLKVFHWRIHYVTEGYPSVQNQGQMPRKNQKRRITLYVKNQQIICLFPALATNSRDGE